MCTGDATTAAQSVIKALELANLDDGYELYQALVADEVFAAACSLSEEAEIHANSHKATRADTDARDAFKRSIPEHAQRVHGRVEGNDA